MRKPQTRHELALIRATLAHARPAAEWVAEQQSYTNHRAIDAQWREERQHVRAMRRKAEKDHGKHREEWLSERTGSILRRDSVGKMLQTLSTGFGMSWSDMSRLLRISVPALRKWRNAGGASHENRQRLAELTAFVEIVRELGVTDPVYWLNAPLQEGYTVTPLDLYTTQTITDLFGACRIRHLWR
ncbi:hypothetical protein [Streptomyces sp. Midd1]|uniref:hypothetical protein n=1 Tax=Streptomyces sp. Midd3 TaxID=3161191 RepID=UPI0034DB0ABE